MSALDPKFDRLLVDYKEACPQPDGSTGFLPGIWNRIEAQKKFLRSARGWASAYVTVAAVLCLLLVVLIAFEAGRTTKSTYVEVLDNSQDSSALIEAGTAPKDAP